MPAPPEAIDPLQLLTKREVAALLGVDAWTVDRWRKKNSGFPEPVWISDATPRWPRGEVANWLAARQRGGVAPDWNRSRTKPWEALGMSRAEWYRLGKPTNQTSAGPETTPREQNQPPPRRNNNNNNAARPVSAPPPVPQRAAPSPPHVSRRRRRRHGRIT